MTRDEFMDKVRELTDFAYERFASYPQDDSVERSKWANIFQSLNQVQREIDDDA